MSCCSGCVGYAAAERQFGPAVAERDLKSYRKKGPGPTTRLLRDLLADTGAIDGTLLDVGSGIGGLTFELLEGGVTRAIAVDASAAYLAAAAQDEVKPRIEG